MPAEAAPRSARVSLNDTHCVQAAIADDRNTHDVSRIERAAKNTRSGARER